MGDSRAREHDGCPYFATVWLGEHSREYWFCNKCGWSEPIASTTATPDSPTQVTPSDSPVTDDGATEG